MDYSEPSMSGSRLRPPSKLPQSSFGLQEMTASDHNVRSAMPPPAVPNGSHTLKHKPSGREWNSLSSSLPKASGLTASASTSVLDSQPKARKTLAEQAGEPYRVKAPAPQTIRHVNPEVSRVTKAGPKAANSFSSTHGRGLPNPGFATSYGAGSSRPGIGRTNSALGHNRSKSQHSSRPATSMGHGRTMSQSSQGQHPAAATPSNGSTPPFPTLNRPNSPTFISSWNMQQPKNRVAPMRRDLSRRTASTQSDNSGTRLSIASMAVGSDRSISDPFVSDSTSVQSSSLCDRFNNLDLGNMVEGLKEIVSREQSEDARALMPPPPLPNKALKNKSSIPRLSPTKGLSSSATSHTCQQPRSPVPGSDLQLVTPKKRGSPKKSPTKHTPQYLTKDCLTPMSGFDIEKRISSMDEMMKIMSKQMEGTNFEQQSLKTIIEAQRDQVAELQLQYKIAVKDNEGMRESNADLQVKNDELLTLRDATVREHQNEMESLKWEHQREVAELHDAHRRETQTLRSQASQDEDTTSRKHRNELDDLVRKHRDELDSREREFRTQLQEVEDRRAREVKELAVQRDEAISKIATGIGEKEREADTIRNDLRMKTLEFENEQEKRINLEASLAEIKEEKIALQAKNTEMTDNVNFLTSNNQQQSDKFEEMRQKMQEALDLAADRDAKLIREETLRRKLHNQIQELKGNIRVFCRVRPMLSTSDNAAKFTYPDKAEDRKELGLMGPEKTNALGKTRPNPHDFSFDRVFDDSATNQDVFDEVSELVQSALDGYNVCIFAYGQTGSGKTYTMSSADGVIPQAIKKIYQEAMDKKEKGWEYTMQGSFVEIYREQINDLLGKSKDIDSKKHTIHLDEQNKTTTVSGIETIELDGPEAVEEIMRRADANKTVAATKANARSSRSHSVFMLKLTGSNSITKENCEATLNLVDLAGSERADHSGVEGKQFQEMTDINKSLSTLGQVIGEIRDQAKHVSYRNSTLTRLLQYSLGGNSKTLMFSMVSPLQEHLGETIQTLKFAEDVSKTRIGTAKKVKAAGK